jgi:peroxiredoxin Q/BCP
LLGPVWLNTGNKPRLRGPDGQGGEARAGATFGSTEATADPETAGNATQQIHFVDLCQERWFRSNFSACLWVLCGMALSLNSPAPDFSLKDSSNQSFTLSQALKNGPVALVFYPKAFTRGCTEEVCTLRDEFAFFRQRGIQLYGISHDTIETQGDFQSKYSLPFPLLSDPMRRVAKLYKAVFPFGLLTRRISYYIGQDGKIKAIHEQLFDGKDHTEQLIQKIQALD